MSRVHGLLAFAALSACEVGEAQDTANDAPPRHTSVPTPADPPSVLDDNQPSQAALTALTGDIKSRFPNYNIAYFVVVNAEAQTLSTIESGKVTNTWLVSTALKGLGARKGSDQTPTGTHRIAQKFGDGAPVGTIFRARQNTGQIARILTGPDERSTVDAVTTRILWLDGLEAGKNKGGNVDSHERYIYIHGTDEEGRLGTPASHGCVRMGNQDVIDLYNRVKENTLVVILPTL